MISFRLTAEEYDRCLRLCQSQNIGTVSEMARGAINLLIQQPERAHFESLETRINALENRLHFVALEIKRLSLTRSKAGDTGNEEGL